MQNILENNKYNKTIFILLKLSHSIIDFFIFLMVFFTIFKNFSGNEAYWVSMVSFVSFTAPYIVFSALNGSLVDKISCIKTLKISALISFCLVIVTKYFFSLNIISVLFLLLFLLGANRALFTTSLLSFLSNKLKNENKGEMITINQGISFLVLLVVMQIIFFNKDVIFITLAFNSILFIASIIVLISSLLLKNDLPQNSKVQIDFLPIAIFKSFEKMRRHGGIKLSLYALSAFWSVISIFCFVMVYRFAFDIISLDFLLTLMSLLFLGGMISSLATSCLFKGRVELGVIPLGAILTSISILSFSFFEPDSAINYFLSFLIGFSLSFFILPTLGYVQNKIPNKNLGRFNATILMMTVFFTFIVVGAFIVVGFAFGVSDKIILRLVSVVSVILTIFACIALPKLFVRCVVWVLVNSVYRLKLIGIENIPRKGGAILVCNHLSYLDPFIIMASISRSVRFLIYDSIYNLKYVKPIAKVLRAIPIPEKCTKDSVRALEEASKAVRKGEIVVIFAEGQVSRVGNMLPFTAGFTRIAKKTNVPVIPICLDRVWGSSWILNDGKFKRSMPKELPYPLTILIGAPIKERANAYKVRRAVQELGAEATKYKKEVFQLLHTSFIRSAKKKPFKKIIMNATGLSLNYVMTLGMALLISRKLKKEFKDDKFVGIMIPPSVEGVLVNIALYFIGKIPVNLNYTAGNDFLLSVEKQTGMKKIITAKKVLEKLNKEKIDSMIFLEELLADVKKSEKIKYILYAFLLPQFLIEKIFLTKRPSRYDMATIIFSSGSTGDPKGVMLSHDNITSDIESMLSTVHFYSNDGIVGILPFFHSFGFAVTLWLPLLRGFKTCYHSNPLDANVIGSMIEKEKLTILVATGMFMSTYIRKCKEEQFKTLRFVVAGAEKLQKKIAEDFTNKFGLRIYEGYGCTELSPVASVNLFNASGYWKEQKGVKDGTVGRPMSQICAKIISLETGEELGPNEEGMLYIKGPNVMMGYYGKPELSAEVLKDGWYVTGDIAICDEEGFIKIVDRVSRFSKIAGEMVPHIKAEEAIQEIYGEAERCCVVTGVSDGKKGEKLVVLHTIDNIDTKEITKKLQSMGLANLWIPKPDDYRKIDNFPVLSTGKLDLRGVKKLAKELFDEDKEQVIEKNLKNNENNM